MNRDKTAHELSFNIIEVMFHQFIARNRYHFNVHTFIGQQINSRSFEDWKLCRHNRGIMLNMTFNFLYFGNVGNETHSNSRLCKARWIHPYPKDDTGDDSDLQLLCSSCHICMIDWCGEEYNYWQTEPFTNR